MNQPNQDRDDDQTQHHLESGLPESDDSKSVEATNAGQPPETDENILQQNTAQIEEKLKKAQDKIEEAVLPFIEKGAEKIVEERLNAPHPTEKSKRVKTENGVLVWDDETNIKLGLAFEKNYDQKYQEYINRLIAKKVQDKYQNNITIEDFNSPDLVIQLADLYKVPPEIIENIVNNGLKINFIKDYMPVLEDYNQDEWIQCGEYDMNSKTITVSIPSLARSYNSDSVALHELGHAYDFLSDQLSDKVESEAHKRLFDKLNNYLKTYEAGGIVGGDEIFAQSFAEYFYYSKDEFVARYDEDWYNIMDQVIKHPEFLSPREKLKKDMESYR